MMTLYWRFILKLQQLPLIRDKIVVSQWIPIVKLIVNSNMNSAPIIRRQLLHVFILHLIGFEGLATMLVSVNMFCKLVLKSLTSRDVSAPGSPFRILVWTCCYRLSGLCSHIQRSHSFWLVKFHDFSQTFPGPEWIFPGPNRIHIAWCLLPDMFQITFTK